MKKFSLFFFVFLLLSPLSRADLFCDPLHGLEVKLLSGYRLCLRSGRILITPYTFNGGVVIFPLKKPPRKGGDYLLKVLALPFARDGKIFYRQKGNFYVAEILATYQDFIPFFDLDYTLALFYQGLSRQPAKAKLLLKEGKHYVLAFLILPPPGEKNAKLREIVESFRWHKPSVPYRRQAVRSTLFGITALWLDLPQGFSLKKALALTKIGEIYEVVVSGPGAGVAALGYVGASFVQNLDPIMPVSMFYYFDPLRGQDVPLGAPLPGPEALIQLVVREITGIPEVRLLPANFPISFPPNLPPPRVYLLRSENPHLEGLATIHANEVRTYPNRAGSYAGLMHFIWGKGKTFDMAQGVLASIELNPRWVNQAAKFMFQEARKEIEHQRWMWNEFRKTQRYISRLHRESMAAEELFQEEMARAFTNILSDYTYARDPETGEVFHLEDTAREYWRDEEGIIWGLPEGVDERLLEARGFKRLEVRPEGFGAW